MRYLFFIFVPLIAFSKVHYAKVEPYETITLKSAVSAQVIDAKVELEGRNIKSAVIIHLDDRLDNIRVKSNGDSLKFVENMIDINQKKLNSLNEFLRRERDHYDRISDISSASTAQKDKAFYGYINTKIQYLSTKEKIKSLKKQRLELLYDIERLRDSIEKKVVILKNKFLYKIFVHKGDFVNMGMPLAEIKDLSRAKLVLFLEEDELEDIKKKSIYIDGKATKYKIEKIWRVADEKFISSYRAEIIIPHNRYKFSRLLKVEIK